MRYEVTVSGRSFEIDVDGETVTVSGRKVTGRLVSIPGSPLRRMSLDGVSRTYAMSRGHDGWQVQRDGRAWLVEVTDERSRNLRKLVGAGKRRPDNGVVLAPMPGLVVRLEVEEGQRVSVGAGLLVLEAMKMENEIRAGTTGIVKRILVRPGQAVDKGAELLEIVSEQG